MATLLLLRSELREGAEKGAVPRQKLPGGAHSQGCARQCDSKAVLASCDEVPCLPHPGPAVLALGTAPAYPLRLQS